MTPCVVLDLETTGFDRGARVVEVGAIVLTAEGELAARCSTLIRQDALHLARPASRAAQKVHGIQDRELLAPTLPTEPEAAERLSRWLAAARERYGGLELRAWGQSFEQRFLARGSWVDALQGWGWGEDCMAVVGAHLGLGAKVKLEEAAKLLDLELPHRRHRALEDAALAARCLLVVEKQRQDAPCWQTAAARPQLPLLPPPESRSLADLSKGAVVASATKPAPLPALPPEEIPNPSWRRRRNPVPSEGTALIPYTPPPDADAEFRAHGCMWWIQPKPGWEYTPKNDPPPKPAPWTPPLFSEVSPALPTRPPSEAA